MHRIMETYHSSHYLKKDLICGPVWGLCINYYVLQIEVYLMRLEDILICKHTDENFGTYNYYIFLQHNDIRFSIRGYDLVNNSFPSQ